VLKHAECGQVQKDHKKITTVTQATSLTQERIPVKLAAMTKSQPDAMQAAKEVKLVPASQNKKKKKKKKNTQM
jgi:hypothetical protein